MTPLPPATSQDIVILSLSMVARMVSVELIVPCSRSTGLVTSIPRAFASGEVSPSPLTTHWNSSLVTVQQKRAVVFRVVLTGSGATKIPEICNTNLRAQISAHHGTNWE